MDEVRFLMSANVGENLKPIAKVASGGELARIMLAMKNVLSEQDRVGTMVFDEVDTGVSGRAAQKVAEGDGHAAALSSRSCMKLYGLECLEAGVQDQGSNFTRFICISKNLEIYPGADRTSLMAVLPHEPGSLCRVLSRFYALGLNLNKLESRPMPERNFEFMFYFDLETPVYAPEFLQLMGCLLYTSPSPRDS